YRTADRRPGSAPHTPKSNFPLSLSGTQPNRSAVEYFARQPSFLILPESPACCFLYAMLSALLNKESFHQDRPNPISGRGFLPAASLRTIQASQTHRLAVLPPHPISARPARLSAPLYLSAERRHPLSLDRSSGYYL